MFKWIVALFITTILLTNTPFVWASNIKVPNGYKLEKVLGGLTNPNIDFDDQGRMLIAESSKVFRIEKDGRKVILGEGEKVVFFDKKIYVVSGGTISIIQNDGTLKDIISDLPAGGDYGVSKPIFKDGKIYFGVGTVSNAGVVSSDKNLLKDIPCKDITITENSVFEPHTSAFSSFGQITPTYWLVPGDVKCNGAILRSNMDGTNLEVYAWGFRNAMALEFSQEGALFVTMQGFEPTGLRPIENGWDCLYRVEKDVWYGWPDFACDTPVTDGRFKPKDGKQPDFIMNNHPTETPPTPLVKFPANFDISGLTFAPNRDWGEMHDLFVAQKGKVVRVNTQNGQVEDFISSDDSSWYPTNLKFGPENSLYIGDSNSIWKVTRVKGVNLTPERSISLESAKKVLLGILIVSGVSWIIWKRLRHQKNSVKRGHLR